MSLLKEKTRTMQSVSKLKNISELKSFWGLINYYHRHFKNSASFLEPLHKLVRKHVQWEWRVDLQCIPYDLAVLLHGMNDGSDRPIAFASHMLTKAEQNYSQTKKERLAIVYTVKKFHQCVFGKKFTILTDHKPLLGILSEDKGIPLMTAGQNAKMGYTLICL